MAMIRVATEPTHIADIRYALRLLQAGCYADTGYGQKIVRCHAKTATAHRLLATIYGHTIVNGHDATAERYGTAIEYAINTLAALR